jgi:hypothetical protein
MKYLYCISTIIITTAWIFCATPANMNAVYRSGQVFITWDEVSNTDKYIIYKSSSAITSGDLTTANKRFEVMQGSAGNKIMALLSGSGHASNFENLQPPCTFTRNVVTPLDSSQSGEAPELAQGKGVVVFTVHEAGTFYYAATAVTGTSEDKSVNSGNTAGPIQEEIKDPEPLLIWQSDSMLARVYLQYLDADSFNLSMHNVAAWPYWIGVTRFYRNTTDKLDVQLTLQGYSGQIAAATNSARLNNQYFGWNPDGIEVFPCEASNWWYGYSQTFQYDSSALMLGSSAPKPDTGPVYNFVQARVMNFMKYLINVDPFYRDRIDTNRIYARGGSMGGGGTLLMMQTYPDFFAYGRASVPVTNFLDAGTWTWYNNITSKTGVGGNNNLLAKFTGWRSGPLNQKYSGYTVTGWLNLEKFLLDHPEVDMPWIGLSSGGRDGSVNWPAQGKNYYTNLDSSRRGWSGGVDGDGGHSCCSQYMTSLTPQTETIRKNNSYPAFSNVSINPSLPIPDNTASQDYHFNHKFMWSTPHYSVGGYQDQVDELNRYEIVIACDGQIATADVTPRRLQNFVVIPGKDYIIKNTRTDDTNNVYQIDTVTADQHGLVTFRGFNVILGSKTAGGSRLIMVPVEPLSIDSKEERPSMQGPTVVCRPNPFRAKAVISIIMHSSTSLRVTDSKVQNVKLEIFDLAGRIVRATCDPPSADATYVWDAGNLPDGVYVVKVKIENQIVSGKILKIQ